VSDGGRLSIYRWAPAISEFYPEVDEEAARRALGPDGYGVLEREEIAGFVAALRTLLADAVARAHSAGTALSGEEIRRLASAWLRTIDPERDGVHYYKIAHAVQQKGAVTGKNPMASVLAVLRQHPNEFEQIGPGRYTWVDPSGNSEVDLERSPRYWAMRSDQSRREDLWAELRAGRLRQGWGWDREMDLRLIADLKARGDPLSDWQRQAWGNRRMLDSLPDGIHEGDLVLVLHMPGERRFSLVRVVGPYRFDGAEQLGDYGHVLPVQLLSGASGVGYSDERLPAELQSALGNRVRLWNLDRFGDTLLGLTEGVGV
jgi:hypothetical protein